MESDGDKSSKVIKEEDMSDDDVTLLEVHEVGEHPSESCQRKAGDTAKAKSQAGSRPAQGLHASQEPEQTSPHVLDYIMDDATENDSTAGNSAGGSRQVYLDTDGVMASFPNNLDSNASSSGGMDQQSWLPWQRDAEVQHSAGEAHTSRKGISKSRKFRCGICGTNFTLLKNAKRHYRVQHLNHFYWCKYCPNGKVMRKYTRRVFLEDHFLTHHPDIDCEVEEVTSDLRNEDFNIICVELYDDEEEEELNMDLVTTTETNLQGGGMSIAETTRGCVQNVTVYPDGQLRTRNDDRLSDSQPYINLAEYHGFTSDSVYNAANASSRLPLKRNQRPSPSAGQPSKLSRVEQRKAGASNEMDSADNDEVQVVAEDESSSHTVDWLPHSVSNSPQVEAPREGGDVSHVSTPGIASRKAKSRSSVPREPYNISSHYSSSDPSHSCLIIGSAVANSSQCDRTSEKVVHKTSPSSVGNGPSRLSDERRMLNAGSNKSQCASNHFQQHMKSGPSPKQEGCVENNGDGWTCSSDGDVCGNVVHSSSDATLNNPMQRTYSKHTDQTIQIKRRNQNSSNFNCKYILENHRDRIKKYSKEIMHKYDESGRVVRKKIIRHTFHFHSSPGQRSECDNSQTLSEVPSDNV